MTVLNGFSTQGGLGGYPNPNVSGDLSAYGLDIWPPHVGESAPLGVQPRSLQAAAASPRVESGQASLSYMDDYYFRVHLRPSRLDFGQLSTSQERSIEVWNAWPNKIQTLNSVQALAADGLIVTAPGDVPFDFAPLQSLIWTLTVTPEGPGRIDATLQWLFADSGENVQIEVTGNRLTAWTIPPDWSNGIMETLIWLTDVGESVDGSQARVPLRDSPQRQWEGNYLVQGRDRQLMESLLYGGASRSYVVPVWWDVTTLPVQLAAGADSIALPTAGRDYAVGAQVMLWVAPNVYELAEVSAVDASTVHLATPLVNVWPVGTRVWPCRNSILSETPKLTRLNAQVSEATIRFEVDEVCDWAAVAPPTTYLGYPVLESRTNEAENPEGNYTRKTVQVNDDVSLPIVDDLSGLAWPTQTHAWCLQGRTMHAVHRSVLYWLQGRAQALWLPSWQSDLTLTGLVPSNALMLNVEWHGLARYLARAPGRRNLRIELRDGTIFYRAVTSVEEIGQASENVGIDTPMGRDVHPEDVRAISWMMLATLDSDSVEIQHITDADGVSLCTVTFVGVPKEEP